MKGRMRIVLGMVIVALALAIGAAPASASRAREQLLAESALAQCYSRCQAAQWINLAWCMQGCRCSTGVEFCPPPGPWDDLQQVRANTDWQHN
jgi:type II secretory pathway pseudopilin PulG